MAWLNLTLLPELSHDVYFWEAKITVSAPNLAFISSMSSEIDLYVRIIDVDRFVDNLNDWD